ncbi:formyltransferase family protein [Halobacterium wangiae]|uniref:formyltransferase family protein n=1 Tax=Halobacterium wangiae TaxID=2902623 RepID=UPI001E514393|nr:formyltransferase family protein [Halobacterium wangiae]
MAESDTTRVCLLAHSDSLPAWEAAAVQRMVEETDAEIGLVVADASDNERSTADAVRRLVELREWGVVAAAMELFGDDLEPLESVPIRAIDGVADAEWVDCVPESVDGWKNALPEHAVERMAETDVAVRFGFGFLVGDALSAPEMGVLSFHHGDFREYRGQPMGFWEYVHGRETAGVTLQRINETLDGGEVVYSKRVHIADAPTWSVVRCRLFDASQDMLAEGVRRLECESFEPETLSEAELGDLYTLPRGHPVVTYLGKTARGVLLE